MQKIIGLALILALDPGEGIWLGDSLGTKVEQLTLLISAGAGSYFVLLWLMGIRVGHLKAQH